MVDTQMWSEGILQRTGTKDLRNHLDEEIKISMSKGQALVKELEGHREAVLECSTKLERVKCDSDKISIAVRVMERTYEKACEFSIVALMKQSVQQQAEAEAIEKKKRDADEEIMDNSHLSTAEKVRRKNYDMRNKEERMFIAMDMVMNPEVYANISLIEAEQMSVDEDYQCELSQYDLERINNLPTSISLALPFLKSGSEMGAHRLFFLFIIFNILQQEKYTQ
jgi:hypothetical protein